MIKFDKVNFAYDKNVILNAFNINFESNKINCIIGPSGSGKTTILNLICKILTPHSGVIQTNSKLISYLFQDNRLIDEITVFKNLELILKTSIKNKSERKILIEHSLKSVGLENTSRMYPQELSGSMQKRLSLIRSFLFPSDILLMDEPFDGLDINIKTEIINLFFKL
jgi:NitT/TauT family transport system ATP-binding protein